MFGSFDVHPAMCFGHIAPPVVVRASTSCGEKITSVLFYLLDKLGAAFVWKKAFPYDWVTHVRGDCSVDNPANSGGTSKSLVKSDGVEFLRQ